MPIEIPMPFCYGFLGGMVGGYAAAQLQQHPTRRGFWIPVGFGLLLSAYLLAAAEGYGWLAGFLAALSMIAGTAGSTRRTVGGPVLIGAAAAMFFTAAMAQPTPTPAIIMAV